jgi:hypothetical protein
VFKIFENGCFLPSLVAYASLPFELKNYSSSIITVQPGEAITYKITYLSIPLGLKLQTNQIGYGRFFTDPGFTRDNGDQPSNVVSQEVLSFRIGITF